MFPVLFGSLLGLWALQPLFQALQTMSGVGSLSGWISHGWPLPQFLHHTYPSMSCRQTNCRLKVLWLGLGPEPSTGQRRWPGQASYPTLTEVSAGVTPQIPGSFHCTRFPAPPRETPPFFPMGSWDPNSSPHNYKTHAFLTEPSMQPWLWSYGDC